MTDSAATPAEVVDAMHAAFRQGDLARIAAHWDEAVVYEAPGVSLSGKAARMEAETVWLDAFSENDVVTEARFVSGDEIVDFCTMSGVHTGPMRLPDGGAMPPTGARISGPYAARYRIREGKVLFQQVIYDRLALLQTLSGQGPVGSVR
jgi:ketosteroid isomerase-like protein